MGTLWRSEEMELVQLFVQIEAAHDMVDELGKRGVIQFQDLNPQINAFQRSFVNEVRRCEEMERRLRFFDEEITKDFGSSGPPATIDIAGADEVQMNDLDARTEELEKELLSTQTNQIELTNTYNGLAELKHVIAADNDFFAKSGAFADSDTDSLLGETGGIKLSFITGVVNRDRMISFERVLWRATRGNLFLKHTEIAEDLKDAKTGESEEKNVVIIFYQGERIEAKIKKICSAFGAHIYNCPEDPDERQKLKEEVNGRIADCESVLHSTLDHKRSIVLEINLSISNWKQKVLMEKSIFHTMNLFNYDIGRKCLIAEGWAPKNAIEEVHSALKTADAKSGSLVPSIISKVRTKEIPPTYFKTNVFTGAFQGIIDAYGIARYREINPTVFTIMTFPFLYGVMFGDACHGSMILLYAIWMILYAKKLSKMDLNELIEMPFSARYVMLLMGIYAIYGGFMYNECFAVGMDWFGSNFKPPPNQDHGTSMIPLSRSLDATYPIGIDPAWKGAQNELVLYNSIKMKLSIILGVLQMSLGIALSGINAWNRKSKRDIIFGFLPEIVFMWSIFGYMVFLIVFKWIYAFGNVNPPALLPIIIAMFLSPGNVSEENWLYTGQAGIQVILVITALLAIPWMLFPKPFLIKREHEKEGFQRLQQSASDDSIEEGEEEAEDFDFTEIFIHQLIHTIEFTLGSISNTASYLRLWALSLAHAELSTVFWEKLVVMVLEMEMSAVPKSFVLFFVWAAWAGITVAVIIIIESLSAFLHALRLHWVEFNNKFYAGDGVKFSPFDYKRLSEKP